MPRKIADNQIRKQLNAKAKRVFEKRLPWPYNGMVSDITSGIQSCCNYLVALGLISYSEMCGRQLFFNGDPQAKNHECLLKFLKYMGSDSALQKLVSYQGEKIHFSDAIRNGLVHEYFMKPAKGSVVMITSAIDALETGFHIPSESEVHLVAVPYFNLFCGAIEKAKTEGILFWKR
jgi:hypothetical protein